jgi:hypothetical protein
MPFTSKLGTSDSVLNNIKLGDGTNANVFIVSFSDTITLTDTMVGQLLNQTYGDTLTLTDTISGSKLILSDSITFTEVMSPKTVLNLTLSDTLTFSELLTHTIFESISDTLVLVDTVTGFAEKVGSWTDTLTMTESLTREFVAGRLYGDALEFAELWSRNIRKLLSYSDTVTFTDALNGVAVKVFGDTMTFSDVLTSFIAKLFHDEIEFGDSLLGNHVSRRTLTDQVVLFDSLAISIYSRQTFSDTLVLSDSFNGFSVRPLIPESITLTDSITGVATKPLSDTIAFTETLNFTRVINKSLTDTLTFTDSASMNKILTLQLNDALTLIEVWQAIRARFGSLSDALSLTDEQLRAVIPRTLEDSLVLVDTMTCQKIGGRVSTDTVTLTDSLAVHTVLNRSLSDAVLFLDAFVVKVVRETTPTPIVTDPIHQVNPPSGLENPPNPVWEAVIDVQPQLILTGVSRSIVLPPPEFNDFESGQGKIVVQRSMTGRFRVYSKRTQREKLNWRFVLPKYKADELREFMLSEIDTLLNVITWDGEYWQLQFLSDTADFTESGRWAPCGNKVEVTIELVGNRYA